MSSGIGRIGPKAGRRPSVTTPRLGPLLVGPAILMSALQSTRQELHLWHPVEGFEQPGESLMRAPSSIGGVHLTFTGMAAELDDR